MALNIFDHIGCLAIHSCVEPVIYNGYKIVSIQNRHKLL